jgi:hypothetical protein
MLENLALLLMLLQHIKARKPDFWKNGTFLALVIRDRSKCSRISFRPPTELNHWWSGIVPVVTLTQPFTTLYFHFWASPPFRRPHSSDPQCAHRCGFPMVPIPLSLWDHWDPWEVAPQVTIIF